MKQGLSFLVAIAILMAVGATTLQCRTLRYVQTVGAVVDYPSDPVGSPVPKAPRLPNPHAVLVLDVSASMKESDPRHLQTEAVKQFYRVYAQLSREALADGEQARLAIVLFSTIAQTIDWTGNREPWLSVSDENSAAFDRVVSRYLGEVGSEPRTGQDTDYLAAIDRVDSLVASISSPPAIVFLTDGVYDIHPLFSPLLSPEAKSQWLNRLAEADAPAARRVLDGEQQFLSAKTLGAIFDTRDIRAQAMALPADLDPLARRAIAEARGKLLSRRNRATAEQPEEGPLWAPLFLGTNSEAVSSARHLLAPLPSPGVGSGTPFTAIEDPRDLAGEFIAVLSRWFRLREIAFSPNGVDVSVPEEVAAFALSLRTTSAGSYAKLTQDDAAVSLSGRDGIWAGVLGKGGRWRIETDGGRVSAGRVFLRPRREWSLFAPPRVLLRTGKEILPVELRLVGLEGAVKASSTVLTANLPRSVSIRVRGRSRDAQMQLTLVDGADITSYRGELPLRDFGAGEIRLIADVALLASSELPIYSDHLEYTAVVEPGLEIVVLTPDGRRTSPNLEGIPRESERIRQLVETWLPRFVRPAGVQ